MYKILKVLKSTLIKMLPTLFFPGFVQNNIFLFVQNNIFLFVQNNIFLFVQNNIFLFVQNNICHEKQFRFVTVCRCPKMGPNIAKEKVRFSLFLFVLSNIVFIFVSL